MPLQQLGLAPGQVFHRLAFGPDGVLAASHGPYIHFVDSADGRLLEKLHAHESDVRCMAWAPAAARGGGRGAVLASCSGEPRVRVWRSPKAPAA